MIVSHFFHFWESNPADILDSRNYIPLKIYIRIIICLKIVFYVGENFLRAWLDKNDIYKECLEVGNEKISTYFSCKSEQIMILNELQVVSMDRYKL